MKTNSEFISFLSKNPRFKTKNLEKLEEKLGNFKKSHENASATEKLYIISDFDATLSKHHEQNDPEKKRLPSTFGVLEQDKSLPKSVSDFAQNNYLKYYPIEMDTTLSKSEKHKHMIKWWSSTQNAVAEANTISKKSLLETVMNSDVCLRENAEVFLKNLNEKNVPCLIFSAGCGQIIDLMLKNKEPKCWYEDNMVLLSNMLIFDEDTDILKCWSRPIIHSLNKSHAIDILDSRAKYGLNQPLDNSIERVTESDSGVQDDRSNDLSETQKSKAKIELQKLQKLVKNRTNVITLGDHIRDGDMKLGMKNIENAIDIGFLNYKIDENLDSYVEKFDFVLVDDMSFNVVNELVKFITE